MMNKSARQFKTVAQIERYRDNKDIHIIDNIYEDCYDEYRPDEQPKEFVREFNAQIRYLFKLVSK